MCALGVRVCVGKVGMCGLGVSVLMFEDSAEDFGGRGVEGGSFVREESPNRTFLIRFLEGDIDFIY